MGLQKNPNAPKAAPTRTSSTTSKGKGPAAKKGPAKKGPAAKKTPSTPPCRRNPFLMANSPPISTTTSSPTDEDCTYERATELKARGSTRAKAVLGKATSKDRKTGLAPLFTLQRKISLGLRTNPPKKTSPKKSPKKSTKKSTKTTAWETSDIEQPSGVVLPLELDSSSSSGDVPAATEVVTVASVLHAEDSGGTSDNTGTGSGLTVVQVQVHAEDSAGGTNPSPSGMDVAAGSCSSPNKKRKSSPTTKDPPGKKKSSTKVIPSYFQIRARNIKKEKFDESNPDLA